MNPDRYSLVNYRVRRFVYVVFSTDILLLASNQTFYGHFGLDIYFRRTRGKKTHQISNFPVL